MAEEFKPLKPNLWGPTTPEERARMDSWKKIDILPTKEELAMELASSTKSITDIKCPRNVLNPGLYFGFIKGFEAAIALGQVDLEALFNNVEVTEEEIAKWEKLEKLVTERTDDV